MSYKQMVLDAHSRGDLSDYTAKKLLDACSYGMTDDLMEQALDDAKTTTKRGLDNDEDYNLRFFVDFITDDILEDTFDIRLDEDDKERLLDYVLKNKSDLKDLVGLRIIVYKWLCGHKHRKAAYPNMTGIEHQEPQYDRDKWAKTAQQAYELVAEKNIDKDTAINFITAKWDDDEIYKFKNWLRYYEAGNAEKYKVKTAFKKDAFGEATELGLPEHMLNPKTRSNQQMSAYRIRKEKTQKEQTMADAQSAKAKMLSRLRALRRLLEKYNTLLPHQNVEQIHDEIYALDKSLMRLNVQATMEDCMIRTAHRIRALGFEEGADLLIKTAQGDDVIEALPEPLNHTPSPAAPSVDLGMVISRLETVGRELKSRNIIRELASIDILLNELGVSAFFPELSFAQSKLIEAFGYSSSKVEDVVSKLRGGMTAQQPDPTPAPMPAPAQAPAPMPIAAPRSPPVAPKEEKLETEKLREAPVGEVKRELPEE